MTAGFFPDDALGRWLATFLCYVGFLLYVTVAAIRGVRHAPQEAVVSVLFLALLPIPFAPTAVYLLQFVVFLVTLGLMGVLQVRFALQRNRAVHAYSVGRHPAPIGLLRWLILLAPAVLVSAHPIVSAITDLRRAGTWPVAVSPAEMSGILAEGVRGVFLAMLVYGGYMVAAWVLDQAWLRTVGRIRLLSADARFVWINVIVGAACVTAVGLMVILGPGRVGGLALIATLVVGLIPAINGLSGMYDAALRRIVILHVLFAVAAALVGGIQAVAAVLALPDPIAWWIALGAAVGIAVVLPAHLDGLLERMFFPRTGRMRARLLAIATEPLRASDRNSAGVELLQRLVHVLDAEGGAFVAEAGAGAPAVLHCVGRVDASVLGGSPAEAAQYVASLVPRVPCVIEDIPLAHQLRLLEAGIVFVCPLTGRKTEATLLLGPRHGWLYDVATVEALRVFASQTGLALENLALVSARAHAAKLAALGEAAARIAHEIRNPLGAARSLVQLAGEADGVATLTAPAITELDRIGQLVSDLLAFARREESMGRAPVDLSAVCQSALGQVAALAQEAGVDVHTSVSPATVDGDGNRLVQVVANLCRNAIEALATSPTARRLELRCLTDNGTAWIEVRDSGPGIPAADLARIFEPFATTKAAGTGLGLPIARRIVEAHGGTIEVERTRESDTVFRVILPLAHPGS